MSDLFFAGKIKLLPGELFAAFYICGTWDREIVEDSELKDYFAPTWPP